MKLTFLYQAGASAATGRITLPFQETMEIQASASVPANGGHGSSRVENFRHRNIFSFRHAESHVVGSYSEKDKAYGTLSAVAIEGLNLLDVVTCDRIVVRLTGKHPEDGSEPSFIPIGSHFENLRIGGYKIDVDLATDLFTEYSTWSKLSHAYASDGKFREDFRKLSLIEREGDTLPESKGIVGCTLARNLDKLPHGLSRRDHGIYVPHFGTVYLGEYFISRNSHRLLMLHVDLGCSLEGCYGAGGGDGSGSTWP